MGFCQVRMIFSYEKSNIYVYKATSKLIRKIDFFHVVCITLNLWIVMKEYTQKLPVHKYIFQLNYLIIKLI